MCQFIPMAPRVLLLLIALNCPKDLKLPKRLFVVLLLPRLPVSLVLLLALLLPRLPVLLVPPASLALLVPLVLPTLRLLLRDRKDLMDRVLLEFPKDLWLRMPAWQFREALMDWTAPVLLKSLLRLAGQICRLALPCPKVPKAQKALEARLAHLALRSLLSPKDLKMVIALSEPARVRIREL